MSGIPYDTTYLTNNNGLEVIKLSNQIQANIMCTLLLENRIFARSGMWIAKYRLMEMDSMDRTLTATAVLWRKGVTLQKASP